ncbi:spore coat protein [Neobittarella massiliensis]|uniref:Spore coat protein n=1 Tax=Neobittarella massiliensis (ex Bilen et al. 2018) TaxID=2041842 RepID=A0A8J6IMJ5_9FIRM|nr:spore coat protein [Neobittarella massiliensis]MBC3516449.1 spore coat protein [Neobittarella massiliensis]
MNTIDDQAILTDMLSSQKHITAQYNTFACECAGKEIKSVMMSLLQDEHQIQMEVFEEMQKRGWYPTPAAKADKINQAKQKATQENPANAQQ